MLSDANSEAVVGRPNIFVAPAAGHRDAPTQSRRVRGVFDDPSNIGTDDAPDVGGGAPGVSPRRGRLHLITAVPLLAAVAVSWLVVATALRTQPAGSKAPGATPSPAAHRALQRRLSVKRGRSSTANGNHRTHNRRLRTSPVRRAPKPHAARRRIPTVRRIEPSLPPAPPAPPATPGRPAAPLHTVTSRPPATHPGSRLPRAVPASAPPEFM